MRNDGKYFEDKSHSVISRLNPEKEVMKNVRIVGKLSESSRQLDVVMREPQDYDFLAFECKDKKASIDTPVVEAYNTKLQDVGAKRGAIVSNSSFTAGAKKMAEKLGIGLLNLVDTEDDAIKTKLVAPTVLVRQRVKSWGYSPDKDLPAALDGSATSLGTIIGRPHQKNATLKEIANELWNEIADTNDDINGVVTRELDDAHAKIDGKIINLPTIKFTFNVEYVRSLGEMDMTQTEGLYNVHDGSYQTTSIKYGPFGDEIFRTWKPIAFAEQNALRPSIILHTRSDLKASHY